MNNAYRDAAGASAGLCISRHCRPDGRLVEFVELARDLHPFFVATQAHPEFKSRPTRPHPLFAGVRKAAVAYSQADHAAGGPRSAGRRRALRRAAEPENGAPTAEGSVPQRARRQASSAS